ncbi:MAG: hypothetical protein ACPG3X_02625 [Opitutales bacterium]
MDWDKCNFKKIGQRQAESKRWEARKEADDKQLTRKGSKSQPSKRKKRKR